MNGVSPVIEGLSEYEIALGGENAGQPEYNPLPALRSPEGIVLTRWEPTEEERQAIADGAHIYLSVLTFNHPFQPVRMQVAPVDHDPNFGPAKKREMRLDDDFELRALLLDANETKRAMEARQMELLKGDAEVNRLAQEAQRAHQALQRKKAEVFSNEPKKLIEVVQ